MLIDLVEESYQNFKGKVARCRNMSIEKVASLAEGRVYTARQAKKLGLIDELGTLHDAIVAAEQAAGLKPDEEVESSNTRKKNLFSTSLAAATTTKRPL